MLNLLTLETNEVKMFVGTARSLPKKGAPFGKAPQSPAKPLCVLVPVRGIVSRPTARAQIFFFYLKKTSFQAFKPIEIELKVKRTLSLINCCVMLIQKLWEPFFPINTFVQS